MSKINYKDVAECINLSYEDMSEMTIDDAIYILNHWVELYYNTKERNNLPRPRLIKAYEIAIECMKEKL